ncbi:Lysophospholipid acyltransferase [Cladophialophora chaetospira]|uniref:Lysophospholipid acyltransferase n=1 Tax=Cladophialophora chaetospira TaxID=386627 RepID=A0AA39CJI5_9EURO|nr:Lysophospholipid acyltransferase [Cladophialophora chaetospira]
MFRVSIAYLNYVFDDPRVLAFLLSSVLATYYLAKHIPGDYMPWTGMVFSMTMLAISRTNYIMNNIDYVIFNPNLTQPQMMLTMKLVSFCWNVRDGRQSSDRTSQVQKDRAVRTMPGLLEFTSYALFFPGLFSEPFLDFVEFQRYMTGANRVGDKGFPQGSPTDARAPSTLPKQWHPPGPTLIALRKGAQGLLLVALFHVLTKRYTVNILLDPNVTKTYNLPSRMLILHIILLTTRIRAYGIWALSEGICIATGLGYTGVDPLTRQPLFEIIENADFWGVEFSNCPKQYLRSWNTTVASWLRHYVYERINATRNKSGFAARTATLAFSALWHGFEPGFYVSFMGVSVLQCAISGMSGFHSQDLMVNEADKVITDLRKLMQNNHFAFASRKHSSSFRNTTTVLRHCLWAVMSWLLCQSLLDYALVPFLAGSLTNILKVWSSLSFYGTAVVVAVLLSTRGSHLLKASLSARELRSRSLSNRLSLVEKKLKVLVKWAGKQLDGTLTNGKRFEM